ncbi:LEA type 2 family protein [Adhaeribacter terreus]|uniref:LEA type 2 family protein n=1 Tax=Adhaeribacter terreus TaxID=529703 RepID=A0ABW0EFL8_9BACT
MSNSNKKKAGLMIAGFLLLIGLLGTLLFYNRHFFYPKVKAVTKLHVEWGKDTTVVQAGIRMQNRLPFSFQIDSVSYQIRHKGEKIGWGKQVQEQSLPALQEQTFDFSLLLDKDRYRKLLTQPQSQDSLELEVLVQIYADPPFIGPQNVAINRTLTTAIPQKPALQIDTFFVKSFSPEGGYIFQLNLNTENVNLPDLEITNLQYAIRLSDSMVINGKTDTAFHIKNGAKMVAVPVHLETSEVIELIRQKLSKKHVWPYEANVSADIKANHKLFENTAVSVTKAGTLDTRKIGSGPMAMPTVKHLENLRLQTKEKNTYLQAELLLHNPTKLPLYLDSARYFLRHKGKVVAQGGKDFEKTLPAKGNQKLELPLTVNNAEYQQLMAQPSGEKEIPLDVEMRFYYNLKGSKPQQISVRKKITVPVTKSPSFEFVDVKIKQLDPELGAQLLVKLKIQSQNPDRLQLDNFRYHLLLKNDIDITGKTQQTILLDSGKTEVEIPVDLSGDNANQLTKGLVQGIESWPYTFTGTAAVTAPNSLLNQTDITLQTSGVYNINSKGTPDFMPEFSKIDTLNITMHYDTAWVHMYAAIYNTLPATIHISQLQVDVIHDNESVGKSEEKLNLDLAPNTNTFAWHTLGVNYGLWEDHVNRSQQQDSMYLNFPTSLVLSLGNLSSQDVQLDLNTRIATPASPVTLLQRLKLRGFGFGQGLKFNAVVAVQNANVKGLTIKNIDYRVSLENGVEICGKINRTYNIPTGISEVLVPMNLSVWEALKLLKRQLLGPPLIDYKINATAQLRTDNPKLSNVFVIFENHNQSNLKQKKTLRNPPQ